MKHLAFGLCAFLALLAAPAFGQAVLRSGDSFDIRLSGMPQEFAAEFATTLTVSEDGTVKMPYIGAVKAAGSTTTQFARTVEAKLMADKIFTNPTAIILQQASSRYVTVGGGVRGSGAIPWSSDLTLSAAITRAGGRGDYANLKKVKVTRDGKQLFFNLTRVGTDPTQNPKLLPGDEVDVPE